MSDDPATWIREQARQINEDMEAAIERAARRSERPPVYRCNEGHGFHRTRTEADCCDNFNRDGDRWDREELRGR